MHARSSCDWTLDSIAAVVQLGRALRLHPLRPVRQAAHLKCEAALRRVSFGAHPDVVPHFLGTGFRRATLMFQSVTHYMRSCSPRRISRASFAAPRPLVRRVVEVLKRSDHPLPQCHQAASDFHRRAARGDSRFGAGPQLAESSGFQVQKF